MSIALMFCTKLTPMSQNGQKLSLIFKTKKLLKLVNSQKNKKNAGNPTFYLK